MKNAYKNLGSGVLDKLVLKFNHVFWETDLNWFNYMPQNPSEYYDWTQTLNLYKFNNQPILVMFNSERSAHKFALMSDEEVLENALKVL
jgi:hypothetical protein